MSKAALGQEARRRMPRKPCFSVKEMVHTCHVGKEVVGGEGDGPQWRGDGRRGEMMRGAPRVK
jgi:hypothetical protein